MENKSDTGEKDKTSNLQDVDDGGSCLKAVDDSLKDKKLKSVMKEDEKGKGIEVNLVKKAKKKKRKQDVAENESKPKAKSKKRRTEDDNLVRGKRFTPEEDEIVKDAVLQYVKLHNLGEKGLEMVMNCHSYPEIKDCWSKIGTCIPYRPPGAIYYRAHTLFERSEKREWTKEETEFLQECYEKYGNNWKLVADALGKNRIHVKDKWRRIKLPNQKAGKWSQEEYQNLFDLVNMDLQLKVATQEKKTMHGMLKDNISWGAISDKLSTRTDCVCCMKWYSQLTSSLVEEDKWSNADDYRLIKALYDLDAACVEDVDWENVLEHRPGEISKKRWDQMVRHIGDHGSKPFTEQVEILSQRYCPDLAETREAWDNIPRTQ
ncbi:hypothetical protein QVD17_26157 [Tagetes erecta]|uniref:Uncharacterized protein n=1 Tax=Tagetes erecta TaxID=13708 RepID=A0AAD8K5Z6_TARER|nr:hypothetical protein QVD17_26157 [Tagetes erecta]